MTPPTATEGIIDKPSHHSVGETVERLKNILQAKGVTLFALIRPKQAVRIGDYIVRTARNRALPCATRS